MTEGRSQNITISGQNFTVYNYGPSLNTHSVGNSVSDNDVIADYTYIISDIASQYPEAGIVYTNNNNFLLRYSVIATLELL